MGIELVILPKVIAYVYLNWVERNEIKDGSELELVLAFMKKVIGVYILNVNIKGRAVHALHANGVWVAV